MQPNVTEFETSNEELEDPAQPLRSINQKYESLGREGTRDGTRTYKRYCAIIARHCLLQSPFSPL